MIHLNAFKAAINRQKIFVVAVQQLDVESFVMI